MSSKKLSLAFPVIVEGRYDRAKLDSILSSPVYTTDGFALFRSEEKKALFTSLAKKTKLIVLTDPDGAGKVIRNYFNSILPKDRIVHLYIPQIGGKEKRKKTSSREGFLGVEGMERELLVSLLSPFESPEKDRKREPIAKADLYAAGLTGKAASARKRDEFASRLGLPAGMSPTAFLDALNVLLTREDFIACLKN